MWGSLGRIIFRSWFRDGMLPFFRNWFRDGMLHFFRCWFRDGMLPFFRSWFRDGILPFFRSWFRDRMLPFFRSWFRDGVLPIFRKNDFFEALWYIFDFFVICLMWNVEALLFDAFWGPGSPACAMSGQLCDFFSRVLMSKLVSFGVLGPPLGANFGVLGPPWATILRVWGYPWADLVRSCRERPLVPDPAPPF